MAQKLQKLYVFLTFLIASAAADNTTVCWKDSSGRGVGKVPGSCPAGQERSGALCYPVCGNGFSGVGPVCWSKCPTGWVDEGALCRKKGGAKTVAKKSHGRGAGTPMVCEPGMDEDAALCYPKCKAGYSGVGPVCWEKCPSKDATDGGAICCRDASTCNAKIRALALGIPEAVAAALLAGMSGDAKAIIQSVIKALEAVVGFVLPKCDTLASPAAAVGAPPAATSASAGRGKKQHNASCSACRLLVDAVYGPIKAGNASVAALTRVVHAVCAKVPMLKGQKAMCDEIAGSVGEISKLVSDGLTPKQVCEKLGMCRSRHARGATAGAAVAKKGAAAAVAVEFDWGAPVIASSRGADCDACRTLVTALELPIKAGNATVQELTKMVQTICDHIPILKVQHMICSAVAGSITLIVKWVSEGLAPKDICEKLRLCTSGQKLHSDKSEDAAKTEL